MKRKTFYCSFKYGAQFKCVSYVLWASQVVLVVKNPPVNAGDLRDMGSIPGLERSCVLKRRIPWTEEPGELQPMGSQSEMTDAVCALVHTHTDVL